MASSGRATTPRSLMTIRHWLFFGGFFTNLKTEESHSTVADVDIKVAMTQHTLLMFAVDIVM
jgi:hypothetical protein